MATFESSLKSKLIYVFAINDDRHKDCLKIGETTIDEDDGSDLFNNAGALQEAAHKRIRQYTKTAGIAYQLLYTEISIFVRSGMINWSVAVSSARSLRVLAVQTNGTAVTWKR